MEKQVLSIEQMQELQELGVDTSNSVMGWFKWNDEDTWHLLNETIIQRREKVETMIESNCFNEDDYKSYKYTFIPTFTLQNILQMIPREIEEHHFILEDNYDEWDMYYFLSIPDNPIHTIGNTKGKTLLEAAFNMLKWCKENGFV